MKAFDLAVKKRLHLTLEYLGAGPPAPCQHTHWEVMAQVAHIRGPD